jgi:hypothetical protein
MAEDQETNGVGDEGGIADYDGNDINDSNDMILTTTVPPVPIIDSGIEENILPDDYFDEENLPVVTVKLIINDQPEGFISDIVTAGITDEILNVETTTPLKDLINNYTTAITQGTYEQLNGTDTQGKQWWSKFI